MKKIFLALMIMVLTVSLFSQQLTYRFANEQLTNGGLTMEFDVELMCDVPGIYLAEHTVSFVYNTVGFGENIVPTNVTVTKGTLLIGEFAGIQFYDIAGVANTFPNTMSASCLTNWGAGAPGPTFFNEAPTVFTDFMHFAITVANPAELAGIAFVEFLMNGQQYYQISAGTVALCADPNFYENDLLTFPLGVIVAGDEWTGDAATTDWFTDGNWLDNSAPTATDDVLIPATASIFPIIEGTTEAECAALEVEALASLTIADGAGLNASGVVLCDGEFMMYSDAGFRNGGIDPLSGGTFLFDRMIEAYPAGDEFLGWHYISSPIAGFENWDMYNYWVNYWNEPATGIDPDFPWVHMEGSLTIPCVPAPLMAIGDMEGWSVKQDYDYACDATNPGTGDHILFAGDFTDVNAATDYTRSYTNAGGHSAAGYNLMGNPYPSWIDMTDFAGLNVHIWDGSADDYLDWAGGGDFTEIPPTQGFFVFDGGAGDVTIAKANTVYGTQPFQKSEMNEVVLLATGNDKQDKTYIRFSEEATAGFDNSGIDAYKLLGTGTAPQIYTVTNGEDFSINTLDETPVVPMSFFAAQSAEYTIEAIETGEFANVVLEDRFTGEQTDLLTSSYTFNYTVNDDAERFFVHFTPLGIGEDLAASIDIWSNDHKIYVQAPAINGDIVVFNMMGQEVVRTEIEPGLNTIPVNDGNSYYVVKVVSSDVARTGKVYVK